MATAVQNVETYLENFAEFSKRAAGHNLPWMRKLRDEAFSRFCETGFPTTRDEDWRFTNISAIARTKFSLPSAAPAVPAESDLKPWIQDGMVRLVFVDGRFLGELSSVGSLPSGVRISSLKEEITGNSSTLEQHFGRYLNFRRDPFSALNTAFAEDGAFVHVRHGISLEKPIHLLFVSTAREAATMTHPRNLLLVERESEATIIEEYVSLSDGPVLSNSATELIAEDGSNVSHYMLEREGTTAFNISTLRIQQGRSSNVASHSLLLGGGLVRNNVHPVLAGEGAECLINGLFIGSGTQHLDNYMYVEHQKAHASSRQFYNGILDDHAHGVFHGRIVVHKDAQKTDAKQTNRNLLLSDDAQIDTKPQLEIYADDVKCTHGATIGQIEENALFYLRSRGIDEASARKLLLSAFARECVERMHPGVARDYADRTIESHLVSIGQRSFASQTGKEAESERVWEEVG
ncbi:MAG TPA: Fe-S cluster assembly protein SufD [Candidatus Sulfotelmatobacter sp.]|nr:Fe-S cluster assembly protein SufD [Candidatus Sulfotelmatobacter sp.]